MVFFQVKSRPLKQRVFNCAETGDVNGLRLLLKERAKETEEAKVEAEATWNCDNGAMTPMQMACVHGHDKSVRSHA